ncbi:MAG: enoyl-CoA hydratase [Caulobacteraceae bacterium]
MTLVVRRDDGPITRLTLNDPRRANALSEAMIAELTAALAEAVGDRSVRVIVLAAEGRIFSAGHDLGELVGGGDKTAHEALFARCSDLMQAIGASPKPVIARVQGAAVAAGCQLVASCDLAFAAEGAKFAVSGIDLGLFCSTPSVALSRMIGRKAALEMLLTGRFVTASEAADMGLINRAVPAGELDRAVEEAAIAIAGKPAEAVALGKAVFQRQIEMGIGAAYALAGERMAENLSFASAQAGIHAFLDRRGAA